MKFTIDPAISKKYPNVKIGYVIANINNAKTHPLVETFKAELPQALKKKHDLDKETYATSPAISLWNAVYKDFEVKAKDHPASVTALIKRVVAGKGIWNISSVVDLYNCHSVLGLAPMGGYDLEKISGDIVLRFGASGEKFTALGATEPVDVKASQVVYADDEQVICWLWNYKDCKQTMITPDTKQALFFIDSADMTKTPSIEETMHSFCSNLQAIGSKVLRFGVVDSANPIVDLLAEKKTIEIKETSEIAATVMEEWILDPRLAADEHVTSIRYAMKM